MPYSYSGIVKDIIREQEKMRGGPNVIPPLNGAQVEAQYKVKVKNMADQIASYKLNIQNDTEVIYKLMIHRNILKVAIKQFLEKTDEQTKQLLISTINEVKKKRENDSEYKEKWWKYVNQENFSGNALWEIKNPEKIDYKPHLLFPDIK